MILLGLGSLLRLDPGAARTLRAGRASSGNFLVGHKRVRENKVARLIDKNRHPEKPIILLRFVFWQQPTFSEYSLIAGHANFSVRASIRLKYFQRANTL